jgi:hypothetical protein
VHFTAGTRVWHRNLPNWPGVVAPDAQGWYRHVTSLGDVHQVFVRVDFERRTTTLANPVYVRADVLLDHPRECDAHQVTP